MDPQNQNNSQIPPPPNNSNIPPVPQPDYPQQQPQQPMPQGQPYQQPGVPPLGYQPGAFQQPPRTNTMAIVSLIMAFAFAPLAPIFGIVALSQIKNSGEGGKGLAIAGIVLGAISLLVTVLIFVTVFLTLPAVQEEARDLERETDLANISAQLEAEYSRSGTVPATLSEGEFTGLSEEALLDPSGGEYSYTAYPLGCTTDCTGYEISTTLEDGTTYSLSSDAQ